MDESTTVRFFAWNSEKHCSEATGETKSIYEIAKSLTLENFIKLFDEYLNLGGKDFQCGKEVGLKLRTTHRTLQRQAICFAFGIISGLSEQEYTDPRNQTAVESAKKITQMVEADELPMGLYI